jgi:hypothetical protein
MDTKKAKSRMAKLRYPLQSLAPFALYWALSLGNPPLAVVFFILMVLSLALTAFAG